MPDDLRLLLVAPQIFGRLDGQFNSLIERQGEPSGISIHGFTARKFEPGFSMNNERSESYLYLDDSYPRLLLHVGRAEKTIWLNKDNEIAPGEWPVQDVDLASIDELDDIDVKLRNPTLQQCVNWWDEWDLPENIRRHVKTVAKAAYDLAILLRREGIPVDPILTHRGGLMHDIDKIETLNQVMGHGEMGGDFFDEQGYPELAEIVRGHIMHTILDANAEDRGWETNLVYFCDKLVEGDRLVPFNYRLDQLKIRYPYYRPAMEEAEPYVWDMSDKICAILSIPDHNHLIKKLIS